MLDMWIASCYNTHMPKKTQAQAQQDLLSIPQDRQDAIKAFIKALTLALLPN